MAGTFLFYDFETDTADPRACRAWQYASIRTDENLVPVPGEEGEGITLWCRPGRDHLPAPEACLVTGLVPQDCDARGETEAPFFRQIHKAVNAPGTTSLGWNSMRFDDLVCRWGFWRNFLDPYGHTWTGGCRVWDLIDLSRACFALRPEGIEWPRTEEGLPTFKLDRLAPANGIEHGGAHDALADVRATLDLARILRERKSRLWEWGLSLTETSTVEDLLDPEQRRPIVHASNRLSPAHGCTTLMTVIGKHPVNKRGFLAWNLRQDPAEFLDASPEEIIRRTFSSREELGDEERFGIKEIKSNRAPFVAPMAVLDECDTDRIELDVDACMRHHELLTANKTIRDAARVRIEQAHRREFMRADDSDDALYDGFIRGRDEDLCSEVHRRAPGELVGLSREFRDQRLIDLLLFFRARNHPDTLDDAERTRWQTRCATRLTEPVGRYDLPWHDWLEHVRTLGQEPGRSEHQRTLLHKVEAWGKALAAQAGLLQ